MLKQVDGWIGVAEAAIYVDLHPKTLKDKLGKGDIQGSRTSLPRGHWKTKKSFLDEWMKTRRSK